MLTVWGDGSAHVRGSFCLLSASVSGTLLSGGSLWAWEEIWSGNPSFSSSMLPTTVCDAGLHKDADSQSSPAPLCRGRTCARARMCVCDKEGRRSVRSRSHVCSVNQRQVEGSFCLTRRRHGAVFDTSFAYRQHISCISKNLKEMNSQTKAAQTFGCAVQTLVE